MTEPYYRTPAYRDAIRQPYHVATYLDWTSDPSAIVGFQNEAEARAYARSRPEPLIDMVRGDLGVRYVRRMIPHPATPGLPPLRDDFQP